MTADIIVIRMDRAAAEALSDALPGQLADDWPPDWPGHFEAFAAGLRAVNDVLDGQAEEADCLKCLQLAVDAADVAHVALHAALLRAARDADHMVLGDRLHAVDGCHVARKAHPAATDPGGYRRDRIPVFITSIEGARWLSASTKRKACKLCFPGKR